MGGRACGKWKTMNMAEWLSMGGRGAYVWSAYGITAVVLIFNWWLLRHQLNTAKLKSKRLAGSKKHTQQDQQERTD